MLHIVCDIARAFNATAFVLGLAVVTSAQEAPPDLTQLAGKTIEMRLTTGSPQSNVKVLKVVPGKTEGSIRSLRVTVGKSKRPVNVGGIKIAEILLDGKPLDVEYNKRRRELVHSPEKRATRIQRRADAIQRLASTRNKFWEPLTEADHARFMKQHRAFLEKVDEALPHLQFHLVETEYYLFSTVLTPAEANGYIQYLDEMYRELCKAFRLSPSENIWCGKCVVIAFRDEPNYQLFESKVMHVRAEGTQGICHSKSDGTVIFAGWKGQSGFAHTLVHETTHGFVHRYLSSASPPSWLNEGMADWLADNIVQGSKIQRRRRRSAQRNLRAGSLGNLFAAERISAEHYGTASSLVDILVQMDKGNQFKEFFDGIKEGKPAEQSLKEAFGMGYAELEQVYGRVIGAGR